MSSALSEAEYWREEVLKFSSGVHQNPAVAADQEVLTCGFTDYRELEEAVELRFLNRPDGAGNTHAMLMGLVRSYLNRRRLRSQLYADVCILFYGHPDLFNRFENLRFMNDGREETRLQIMEWRRRVRNEIMGAISAVLADCWSAIMKLGRIIIRTPQTLDGRNLDFIARTCFSTGFRPNNGFFSQNPITVRHLVLPPLMDKQAHFRRLDCLLTRYFNEVASGGI